ncbi:hypothetical protein NBT05_17265 [Aquimarina sp. ERC-38]|uniref:hypothetical protein n=1 Tax=Aquimarina sp. ERC-38 TaxID=2949996 RepID=UPI0022476236|nr:hypothetical protein [Aquimarina sp. ERC-38]UZO80678.1 hypothetical protein NBT05_17265 [Aquimarina sp. ERC-38]
MLFLLGGLLFISCDKEKSKPKTLTEEKFFNLEQVGWKSKAITNFRDDIAFKATMVPLQYYILKHEGSQNLEKVDSIYQSLKEERIIEVEFQQEREDDLLKNKYTSRDYETSVKYMSFSMQNDFKALVDNKDTIPCSGLTFERNFKVAPFKRVLLYFDNIPEGVPITLLYDDTLFSKGFMRFNFTDTPIIL